MIDQGLYKEASAVVEVIGILEQIIEDFKI